MSVKFISQTYWPYESIPLKMFWNDDSTGVQVPIIFPYTAGQVLNNDLVGLARFTVTDQATGQVAITTQNGVSVPLSNINFSALGSAQQWAVNTIAEGLPVGKYDLSALYRIRNGGGITLELPLNFSFEVSYAANQPNPRV